MKKIIYSGITVLIAILVLEIGCFVLLRFSNLEAVKKKTLSEQDRRTETVAPPMYVIHPYYGFVINPAYVAFLKRNTPNHPYVDHVPNVGKDGFFGEVGPLQAVGDNELVVAVVGGSVACFEAAQGHEILVDKFEKLYHRPVRLLNLALWAGKEPQQLLILSDLIAQGAHFDIVINLDGFNEIALPAAHGNVAQHISPFFPQGWKTLAETGNQGNDAPMSLLILNIKYVNNALNAFEEHFLFSNTVRLFSILQNKILNNIASSFEQKMRMSRTDTSDAYQMSKNGNIFLGPRVSYDTSKNDYYTVLAEHWFRCSILLHNLVASQCGRYFHFLQPNQYAQNKILTDEEKANAFAADSIYKEYVERGYPVLRRYGERLKELGIAYKDLSPIFVNTSASVYKDTCCHFNATGIAAIAQAIVDTVRETPYTREQASPRVVPLCATEALEPREAR